MIKMPALPTRDEIQKWYMFGSPDHMRNLSPDALTTLSATDRALYYALSRAMYDSRNHEIDYMRRMRG